MPRTHAAAGFRSRTARYRPAELLAALHRRRGPVIGSRWYVYLLGAEANRFVFANSDAFRWREAFQGLVPVDGPTSLIVSDGEEHRRRRRLVQPSMHHRRIDGYLDIMARNADAAIDGWMPGRDVDVYQELRAVIRRSTIESLFGSELAADASFFGMHLQGLLDMVDSPPQLLELRRRLGTPAWRRAMAARERVDERVYAEIARVRAAGADEGNVLGSLVHGRDEDGNALSEQEIRDQAVSLIAAGYETTSAAMAWAVYAALSTPGVWDHAAEEVRTVLDGRPPGAGDLPRLGYLSGVVQETLRLYPPAVVSARKVARDVEFAGQRIRAGALLVFSPYVTHRLPELWPDPLSFRPLRWDPGEPGYRKPRPHEYLPFSAGPHRCVGATMATTELTVLLARVLARTSLFLPPQRIRPTGFAAMRPRDGLRVTVHSRR